VLEARISGPAEAPLIHGTASLQNASLRYEQSTLTQINTALTFTQQDVSIPKLTAKLNGADLSLQMTGRQLTTQPDVHAEGTLTELDLAKLLPATKQSSQNRLKKDIAWSSDACFLNCVAWAAPAPSSSLPPAKLSGRFTVGRIKHEFYDAKNMELQWDLTGVTPDLSRVSGSAHLKQGAGVLKDVQKLAEMSKLAKVALTPILTLQRLDKDGKFQFLHLPALQRIPFDGIRGDYALRSGIMDVKTFDLTGQDLNINTVGTIGLAGAQPLDLSVTMKLPAGAIGGTGGQLLNDASGRAVIPFFIKGTAAAPEVKLDTREAGRRAVQQIQEKVFTPENKEKLEKALKNIFR
jgi:uncharacterized protein YhdP